MYVSYSVPCVGNRAQEYALALIIVPAEIATDADVVDEADGTDVVAEADEADVSD